MSALTPCFSVTLLEQPEMSLPLAWKLGILHFKWMKKKGLGYLQLESVAMGYWFLHNKEINKKTPNYPSTESWTKVDGLTD